jgi:hypothetical protein
LTAADPQSGVMPEHAFAAPDRQAPDIRFVIVDAVAGGLAPGPREVLRWNPATGELVDLSDKKGGRL